MKIPSDLGGRRGSRERRRRSVPIDFHDRRSGKDRRSGCDRRSGRDRRSPEGIRPMIGADRRRAFRHEPLFLQAQPPSV